MKRPYELAEAVLQEGEVTAKVQGVPNQFTSIDLYGSSALENVTSGGCDKCFHLENESGTGNITLYRVFPGVELVYNDMHMAYCNKNQQPAPNVMEINYCKEGRSECLFGTDQYCYMSAGDLSFCSLHNNAHQSEFPTIHYHGITVTIDFSAIAWEMQKVLELLNVDMERIHRLSQENQFTIIRADPMIEHIFSELYEVPTPVRRGYIRVKILELLLILTGLTPAEQTEKHACFPAAQIATVKRLHAFLVAHIDEHYTIDALAERFQLSPTVLKKCFRGVYGEPVYAYMKRYRLQAAAQMLRETEFTVGEIAARIGYLNQNKFSSAFCEVYGVPPTVYRKKV